MSKNSRWNFLPIWILTEQVSTLCLLIIRYSHGGISPYSNYGCRIETPFVQHGTRTKLCNSRSMSRKYGSLMIKRSQWWIVQNWIASSSSRVDEEEKKTSFTNTRYSCKEWQIVVIILLAVVEWSLFIYINWYNTWNSQRNKNYVNSQFLLRM